MRVALVGTVLLEIVLAVSSAARTPVDSTTLLRYGTGREPLVPVTVNGTGPLMFILDTGSSHSVVSDEIARTVGIPAIAKTSVATISGNRLVAVGRVDQLRIGPITARDVLPSIVPAEQIDPKKRVSGIVGQDVLAKVCYTIDFAAGQVVWHLNGEHPSVNGSVFHLRYERERFVVDLVQEDRALRLVPDSGAATLVLVDQELPPITYAAGRAAISTLAATRGVRPVTVTALRIGGATLLGVPAVLVEPGSVGTDVDGLLPLHLFERVTFDGPNRSLVIETRSLARP